MLLGLSLKSLKQEILKRITSPQGKFFPEVSSIGDEGRQLPAVRFLPGPLPLSPIALLGTTSPCQLRDIFRDP